MTDSAGALGPPGWIGRLGGRLLVVCCTSLTVLVAGFYLYAQLRVPQIGLDFRSSLYSPLKGLLQGFDAYDPLSADYQRRFGEHVPAGPYAPAALLLAAPWAALGATSAALMNLLANMAALVVGSWLMLPAPRSRATLSVLLVLVFASAAGAATFATGQPIAFFYLGVAMLTIAARRPNAWWIEPAGLALLMLKPQTGAPMALGLLLLRKGRIVLTAAGIVALASLPGLILALRAAGGPSGLWGALQRNLTFLQTYGPNDLENPSQARIDAVGLLTRILGSQFKGQGLLVAVVLTAGLAFSLRRQIGGRYSAGYEPGVLVLLLSYCLLVSYHQIYDLLLVLPVCVLVLLDRSMPSIRHALLKLVAGALLVVQIAFGFVGRVVAPSVFTGEPAKVRAATLTTIVLAAMWLAASIAGGPARFGRPQQTTTTRPG